MKNSTKYFWLTLPIVFSPNLAHASGGHDVGNGGDGVVCRDKNQKIIKVELLDFYEAKIFWLLNYSLGDPTLSPLEKVSLALDRLSRLDPVRSQKYQQVASHFFENTRFLTGVVLPDITDSGYVPIPSNCAIEQIAIQKEPLLPEEMTYLINQDLWDQLDNDHKAGLMLHEIVYGDALRRGHENSIHTRYFNAVISSNILSVMDPLIYRKRLNLIGMNFFWEKYAGEDEFHALGGHEFRYYESELDHLSTKNFCESFWPANEATLSSSYILFDPWLWQKSKIGRQIRNTYAEPIALWFNQLDYYEQVAIYRNEIVTNEHRDPEEKHLFLCERDTEHDLPTVILTGNGGDVLVCRDNAGQITSLELLDFYEARILLDMKYSFGTEPISPYQKASYALKRLSRLDPTRAEKYQKQLNTFFESARFLSGVPLTDIPDHSYIPLPPTCRVIQIAIHLEPRFPEEGSYIIHQDFWNRLDDDHKAGLMLHEIIFGDALKYEHKDAKNTRYFAALVSSNKLASMDPKAYNDLPAFTLDSTGHCSITEGSG